MSPWPYLIALASLSALISASWYDEAEVDWNLNVNQNAASPLEYSTSWHNHTYTPSPKNWRMPFYSFFLDRFVNGDPSNDNANGTAWEHDPTGSQLRHGGDLKGVVDSLDYLHGLGIRGIYLVGSMMINLPWSSDGYSPRDHTILDHHFGTLQEVRDAIDAIHARGMYVIADNTMSTMSDLFGFEGYYNSSAPWSFTEHHMNYKTGLRYRDFSHSNNFETQCSTQYPRFWDLEGQLIDDNSTRAMVGCMDSDFDQYGDTGAFGIYPEWRKQLSKFGGVQDRLREWKPSVLDKLTHLSCLQIQGLDLDGFRIDKGMQVVVDSQANFSRAMRQCAMNVGKTNFFIPGEIVNGNTDGAIYIGRGKEPHMSYSSVMEAVTSNSTSANPSTNFIREAGYQAVDAGAFHYTTYRALTEYLGLDGELTAPNDSPVNFQEQWTSFMMTNDLSNAYTGEFDPRHMYGVSNQDVYRWPGFVNGTQRQLLGEFIVTMLMPGIPLVSWGEEQAFYTLDNTANNYIYGRQSMSSSLAWQMHGCNKIGDAKIYQAPFNSSLTACQDDSVSLDHRDPSHPVYGVMKQMYEMRQRYPILNDGWMVKELSAQTWNWTQPGANGVGTVTGLWSVLRSGMDEVQDFTGQGMFGNQSVWLLHSNNNGSITYDSGCTNGKNAILSPFAPGTTVRNMFYPFDQWVVESFNSSTGCVSNMNMSMYGWKSFVPLEGWVAPSPLVTRFLPGHDARILSNTGVDEPSSTDIEVRFSDQMDCDSFESGVSVSSKTESGKQAYLDTSTLDCLTIDPQFEAHYAGPSPSIWRAKFTLKNAYDGIHVISVNNVTNQAGIASTNSNDNFMLRIGQTENPLVFPRQANYSASLLFPSKISKRDTSITDSGLYITHKAAGADKWRYSLSWGAVWSDWMPYVPGNATLPSQTWTGTERQKWDGDHVRVQYWSSAAGSSDHIVEGDIVSSDKPTRRFPHLFIHGSFNQYGYDAGVPNEMSQLNNGTWKFDFMTEWPSQFQVNVWGTDANGQPDLSCAMGDVDNDTVLDRISPLSLNPVVTNITDLPPSPHLAWRILFNDGDLRYYLVPVGSRWTQLAMWIAMALIPVITASVAAYAYKGAFAVVKFNQIGLSDVKTILPVSFRSAFKHPIQGAVSRLSPKAPIPTSDTPRRSIEVACIGADDGIGAVVESPRRTVLIGTMEYDISDWNIKIKIGGLGVMAQLMGKNLDHQDLVWVIPCVGGIDYPVDVRGLPINVVILGRMYQVQVQYHKLNNITYVLLDAPVFRKQTQKEPYPARMDDLDSAIYYSAWNQCLAEAMRRFPIDLYHINDYHGTVAPLYLLPKTVPCCLSLHNAEFQGLWPMRSAKETSEICAVFDLPQTVVSRYVQFGEVFNLLHAGASILRIHQKGFGAVGVSTKYGKRSWLRYPILWGLPSIGALPNPDPSDTEAWDKQLANADEVTIDPVFEAARPALKRQAQEWAGLEQRADADLFVFVGRWSMQKGIDLIADVFPNILEVYPHTQLICIGPTIDLYGQFAALKLDVMMKKYPGRVYSKPEFTALPSFIFSGAEFALIPSRDEPFGLVAVEFGRKGALGVGSRVGGLGQMPGWWFTVESSTTKHMMKQFKTAIHGALKADMNTRATMRARSAKQRFPVAQWKERLEILQSTSIKLHQRQMDRISRRRMGLESEDHTSSGRSTPALPGWMTPRSRAASPTGGMSPRIGSPMNSLPVTRSSSPVRGLRDSPSNASLADRMSLSLGTRRGPGHGQAHHVRSSSSLRYSIDDPAAQRSPRTGNPDEHFITQESAEEARLRSRLGNAEAQALELASGAGSNQRDHAPTPAPHAYSSGRPLSRVTEVPIDQYSPLDPPDLPFLEMGAHSRPETPLSSEMIVSEKTREQPQDILPFFTDPTGLYHKTFERQLANLNGSNSERTLCVEEYLVKSEKQWFNRMYAAKMSNADSESNSRAMTPAGSIYEGFDTDERAAQFLLPQDYVAPTGLRRLMTFKVGDWPIYSFLIALGQILAANSYQITLLTGQIGEQASRLYVVCSIYLATSVIWWYMFRRLPSIYCLSLPWLFYGLGFFLLGLSPYGPSPNARGWIQNVATAMYAIASSSGALFFSQNFGSMGTAPVSDWAFRACAIQGTQQLYVIALWFWGDTLTSASASGRAISYTWQVTAIGIPIAICLWTIGVVLFIGLPDYYRQKPGAVPDFYVSIFRRKIIVWFFIAVFIQNIFMSAPYGRNWAYLWSSKHAPGWAIFLLVLLFFVILWILALWSFSTLSSTHTWILPMFAVGLGAPRFCQILWSTSNIGTYLPWAGSPLASALLGRGLWLWLGLLDSIQGVGFGMILLQTLVRFHVAFTLMGAQVIGSVATIIARADGLNSLGPGATFPSFAASYTGLSSVWFWVALIFQLIVCAGFFKFFRSEQLTKP
ncbi:hypothetical protein LTR37_006242 [Vermiconidia calcicola]|uniref:Uncharacterized protein n=1 Tax=Vermiconidia calcicola TaxID=1690605 RepID=A0ACC3NHW0_9PEZI|nr:hypothetical protein LTR37_006242 [Vermiconidia calcicola]